MYPSNVWSVSKNADAMLWISYMNTNKPDYFVEINALMAPIIQKYSIEVIPTSILFFEPGMTAGIVAHANLLPSEYPNEFTLGHAISSELSGAKLLILEAGSRSPKPISPKLFAELKNMSTFL